MKTILDSQVAFLNEVKKRLNRDEDIADIISTLTARIKNLNNKRQKIIYDYKQRHNRNNKKVQTTSNEISTVRNR